MRWVKHMTASHTDEKLCAVLDELGLEGYGFWWMLVEIVAGQINPKESKCSVTYSLPQWSRYLYCHHNKVSKYLGNLQGNGLVTVETIEGRVRVTIPNLLKYRDEYTRKSGQSPDNGLTINTDTEADTNTNTDTETDKKEEPRKRDTAPRKKKTALPENFQVSERVKAWATLKGFEQLQEHLESFISKAKARGYTYIDWDEALMGAIREDWAGLRKPNNRSPPGKPSKPAETFADKTYTGTPEEKISWL